MVTRALRRHREMLAKFHDRRILTNAWGWRYWVEPSFWRGSMSHRWRPPGEQLMSERGHHRGWCHPMMIERDRSIEHQALRAVVRGIDADSLYWPLHKKPWVYYW